MLVVTALSVGKHPYGLLAGTTSLVVDLAKCSNSCCHKCVPSQTAARISPDELMLLSDTVDTISLVGGDISKQDSATLSELRALSCAREVRLILSTCGVEPLTPLPNEHIVVTGPHHKKPCSQALLAASEIHWCVDSLSDLAFLGCLLEGVGTPLSLAIGSSLSVDEVRRHAAVLNLGAMLMEAIDSIKHA